MERKERIERILRKRFSPTQLSVEDFTQEHAGHPGQGGGMETHIRIKINAEEFQESSLLTAHRKIQEELKHEFQEGLHALEIHILK